MTDFVWSIWSEGYLCTGMEGRPAPAFHHGDVAAPTFREACATKHFKDDPLFDAERMAFWDCRVFDNEANARELLG